jgi:hypothetical protein
MPSPYGTAYRKARRSLLGRRCHLCGALGADSADHVPALYEHEHVEGAGCCHLEPAHLLCNVRAGGWRAANRKRRARVAGVPLRPAPRSSREW